MQGEGYDQNRGRGVRPEQEEGVRPEGHYTASPDHGAGNSSSSSSIGQASEPPSSKLDLGHILQYLQTYRQAHEQYVVQRIAATRLLLQKLSYTVSSLAKTAHATSYLQPLQRAGLSSISSTSKQGYLLGTCPTPMNAPTEGWLG